MANPQITSAQIEDRELLAKILANPKLAMLMRLKSFDPDMVTPFPRDFIDFPSKFDLDVDKAKKQGNPRIHLRDEYHNWLMSELLKSRIRT